MTPLVGVNFTGCRKTCPTSLQLLDLSWWGRRFRLPFGTFVEFVRSFVGQRQALPSWFA
jgi:hypothetical protein